MKSHLKKKKNQPDEQPVFPERFGQAADTSYPSDMSHSMANGPRAEGLAYKQLVSDTDFIRLPPHPVPLRSPVTFAVTAIFF